MFSSQKLLIEIAIDMALHKSTDQHCNINQLHCYEHMPTEAE